MKLLLHLGLALVVLASCRTQKEVTNNYLRDVSDTTIRDSVPLQLPVIRKGDLLSIKVYSLANGIDPRADAPYNLPAEAGTSGGLQTSGFLVNDEGNIEYPQLGILHVEGLTRGQLAETIKQRLQSQLNQPTVVVRFLNFRITVLGEVGSPGTFTAPTERISILEALGLAGDVTEFGQKKTVKVIRESDSQREIGTIDLTSKEMFASPYFILQQNDVVLVEQTERRTKQQERQELVQQVGIASSIITAIALLLNLIK